MYKYDLPQNTTKYITKKAYTKLSFLRDDHQSKNTKKFPKNSHNIQNNISQNTKTKNEIKNKIDEFVYL